jgi:hypothetical protein
MTQTNWKASYGKVRKRFMAAIAMLLISAIMLVSSTYAWFVLSTAPEVKGMSTTVGANGSLEIALRSTNAETGEEVPITSGTADSIVATGDWLKTNVTWGNIIDLSDPSYGFTAVDNQITLYPARLNLTAGDGGAYTVNTASPLIAPRYGTDGRVATIDKDLTTGVFAGDGYVTGRVGVRGIGDYVVSASGASQTVTKADLAARARTKMTEAANSATTGIGTAVNTVIRYVGMMQGDETVVDAAVGEGIIAFIESFQAQAHKLEQAVGFAYLMESLAADGWAAQADTAPATILTQYSEYTAAQVSSSAAAGGNAQLAAAELVTILASAQTALTRAQSALVADGANAGKYTVNTLKQAVNAIFDYNEMYVNTSMSGFHHLADGANGNVKAGWLMDATAVYMYESAGAIANIAALTGKYDFYMNQASARAYITSESFPSGGNADSYAGVVNPGYLAQVAVTSSTDPACTYSSDAANGSTYGFAVDMAFRTNADGDLLLSAPTARVAGDESQSTELMGAGSTVATENASVMAAVRVVFVDPASGTVYGIAKPTDAGLLVMQTISDVTNGVVTLTEAALNPITALSAADAQKNITAIVYLDGDAYNGEGGSGAAVAVNLQFASSAVLTPMDYNGYLEYGGYANGTGTAVGATTTLPMPADVDASTVTWISNDPAIATVSGGTVTGVAAGTALITARWPAGTGYEAGSQVYRVLIIEG